MKINPEEIAVPLEKTVSYENGEIVVSLAKMSEEKSEKYKKFMASCMGDSKAYVDTEGMDKENAQKTCAMYWEKSKGKIEIEIEEEDDEDEKMEKEEMEDSDASGQKTKLLSKDDIKEKDPKGEKITVIDKKDK
jgi:hypothetical protein